SGGIIGSLTSSIYMPLSILAALIGAGALIVSLAKRQFREGLYQVLWMAGAFVTGLALLLNPLMLARAPMGFMNAMTACITGAINGKNCMESTSSSSSDMEDTLDGFGGRKECL